MRLRQRPTSSRAIRTWIVCSRRASRRAETLEPDGTVERAERHRAVPGRARADASAAVAERAAARRPGRRGDRPAASARAALLTRRADGRAAARAARPWRRRARRSGRTCRACGRRGAAAPSASAAPAPAARPPLSSVRSSARVSCRQSSSAHSRSPSSERRPAEQLRRRADRQLRQRAPGLVDGDRRQRLLVHVHPDHDHRDRLLQRWGRPASGQTSIEAAATLLSGHARRSREGGGDTTLASQPTGDMRE